MTLISLHKTFFVLDGIHVPFFRRRKNMVIRGTTFFPKYTDKKENQIFLIYKEIQSGVVSKSYMRKGFLIYEEKRKYFPMYCMRRPLVIYDFATAPF